MVMRPLVGLSRPAMMRMVVVLPAPFGPRKPWISPGATERLTPSTAVKEPYFLTSASTAIIAVRTAATSSGSRCRAWARGSPGAAGPGPAARRAAACSLLLDVHLEDAHLRAADGGQDGGLAIQAAAGEPDVGGVGGELVQGRIDGQPEAAARAPPARRPRARRGSRTRRARRRGPTAIRAGTPRARAMATYSAVCSLQSPTRVRRTSSAEGRLTVGFFSRSAFT